jgi:hypothetical protein
MNIYRVSQTINNDWDTYDSFVCIAESEKIARHMHPCGHLMTGDQWKENKMSWGSWAFSPDDVRVEFIGVSIYPIDDTIEEQRRIVCSSFKAG